MDGILLRPYFLDSHGSMARPIKCIIDISTFSGTPAVTQEFRLA